VQIITEPSIELTNELMQAADIVIATGGGAMVKAAYSSGNPPTAWDQATSSASLTQVSATKTPCPKSSPAGPLTTASSAPENKAPSFPPKTKKRSLTFHTKQSPCTWKKKKTFRNSGTPSLTMA
jgi:hypothetical protein